MFHPRPLRLFRLMFDSAMILFSRKLYLKYYFVVCIPQWLLYLRSICRNTSAGFELPAEKFKVDPRAMNEKMIAIAITGWLGMQQCLLQWAAYRAATVHISPVLVILHVHLMRLSDVHLMSVHLMGLSDVHLMCLSPAHQNKLGSRQISHRADTLQLSL